MLRPVDARDRTKIIGAEIHATTLAAQALPAPRPSAAIARTAGDDQPAQAGARGQSEKSHSQSHRSRGGVATRLARLQSAQLTAGKQRRTLVDILVVLLEAIMQRRHRAEPTALPQSPPSLPAGRQAMNR
eukprot:scaffold12734_cov101-Isochrysis_galbana.AAC.2